MAKATASKSNGSNAPHKHLHSRISFLYQAATFLLATNRQKSPGKTDGTPRTAGQAGGETKSQLSPEATRLSAHLGGVSRKSQIRLASKMKRTICKRCDSVLIPGMTSSEAITNSSKNGRKPWADVLEVRCSNCGSVKRFPVGISTRKLKGSDRSADEEEKQAIST